MGRDGPAFMAYANFAAYTEWNNSLIYSTTAGYLATRIAGAAPMRKPAGTGRATAVQRAQANCSNCWSAPASTSARSTACWASRAAAAVKAMQIKYGLPADSWPTAELLARMRGGTRSTGASICTIAHAPRKRGIQYAAAFDSQLSNTGSAFRR